MAVINFTKYSGAGNDFIALNNMNGWLKEDGREKLIEEMCQRRLAIGADGVIILEPSKTADFRMRYYNSDGGEANCGNGARCIAKFAYLEKVADKKMNFDTMSGIYQAEVKDDGNVIIDMTDPIDLRENVDIILDNFSTKSDFINTGVPHVVIEIDDIEMDGLVEIGRKIRYYEKFQPAGTNVDFIKVIDNHNILIRTYERGVEDETLACGTGSIASAVISGLKGKVISPVNMKTRGGLILKIYFQINDGKKITNVRLDGEARPVFKGEYTIKDI